MKCPLCDTEAWDVDWPFTPTIYTGVCGSVWGDGIEPRQSESCRVIAGLRFEVAILRMTSGEVTA